MCDADPTPGSYKLHVISPEKQKARILHGHESTILVKPSKDHADAFKSGLDSSPPLKIIKHVRTIACNRMFLFFNFTIFVGMGYCCKAWARPLQRSWEMKMTTENVFINNCFYYT
jgi:hypothetical protein